MNTRALYWRLTNCKSCIYCQTVMRKWIQKTIWLFFSKNLCFVRLCKTVLPKWEHTNEEAHWSVHSAICKDNFSHTYLNGQLCPIFCRSGLKKWIHVGTILRSHYSRFRGSSPENPISKIPKEFQNKNNLFKK